MCCPGMEVEKAFYTWFEGNGGWISPKIAFKDYNEIDAGRGMIALDYLKKDEIIFKIPKSLLLTHRSTQFKAEILRNTSREGWSRIMWAIALERLAGEKSFWKPYFDIVPPTFSLPISWNEADRVFLDGTGVNEKIGDPEADFMKTFIPVSKKLDFCKNINVDRLRELYFYSGSLVSSYSFMEDDGTIAMVPLADMLNHKTGHNNARLFFGKDELLMMTIKEISMGSQLYNTYGDIGNVELLFKYGFIDDPNPFSSIELHIQDFIDFIDQHTCTAHNPSLVCHTAIESAYDKGKISESVNLSKVPKIEKEVLKWFQKAYKEQSDLKSCVVDFLEFRKKSFNFEGVPQNRNQQVARALSKEQLSIIDTYISFINS